MVRWKVCRQMESVSSDGQMESVSSDGQMESVSSDGLMENKVAAADGAAWQSLPPYFTIASSTACDKSVPIHTGIVAGALPLPVTSCSSGTSFSTLKRIKTYLRSTCGNERLTSLALMHIYRDVSVCSQEMVDRFARL